MHISSRSKNADAWKLLGLSVLFVGLVARFVGISGDIFDYDSYSVMRGVEASFTEYIKIQSSFYLPLNVHYWLSYRVFGGDLSDYLILPVAASLTMLLVVYWGLNKYWPDRPSMHFFALAILAFNGHSLHLAGYAMFTYANSLLVSCFLFFLFLRLAIDELTAKQWRLLSLIIVPAAFFSNMTLIVPVGIGILSVTLFRLRAATALLNFKHIAKTLWQFKPLAIFPLMYIIVQIIHPINNLGADKRPDMAPWFFYSSQHSNEPFGIVKYTINNTYDLLTGLLSPNYLMQNMKYMFLGTALIVIVVIGYQLAKRELDPKISFTLVFTLLTLFAILAGGISGIYPFGNARYANYLLLPIILLLSHSLSYLVARLSVGPIKENRVKPILLILAIVLMFTGTSINARKFQANIQVKTQNFAALETIKKAEVDMVLFSSYSSPILTAKLPNKYPSWHDMGWGTFYGHGKDGGVPDEILDCIINNPRQGTAKRVLVIAPDRNMFQDLYPSWSALMDKYFYPAEDISAPSIWVGFYESKLTARS